MLRRRASDARDEGTQPPEPRGLDLPHGRIGAQISAPLSEDEPQTPSISGGRLLAAATSMASPDGFPPLFSEFSGSMVTTTLQERFAVATGASRKPSSSRTGSHVSRTSPKQSPARTLSKTRSGSQATGAAVFPTLSWDKSSASASKITLSHDRLWASAPAVSLSSVSGYSPLDLAAGQAGNLTHPASRPAPHSLGLSIEGNDVGYVATVRFGSKDKTFRLLIDSGSADTWIPGGACKGCGAGHARLAKNDSDTLRHFPSRSVNVRYGTGQMSGSVASDSLTISGMSVQNFTFALANQTSTEFSDPSVPFDGLMGLAKHELCTYGGYTPIDVLHSSGLVAAPVMGYRLGRIADGKAKNDGLVSFGGVDGSAIKGSLVEVPNVSKSGFWEAQLDKITLNGTDLSLDGRTAILDTGTSLMILPTSDAQAYHDAIPGSQPDGQGGWTIPCTTSASLALTVGGTSFAIDPRDLTWLPVDKNNLRGRCVSAISGGGSNKQWLVGATFLKNVYLATNAKKDTIGLASLA